MAGVLHVVHVLVGLDTGGAETMMLRFITGSDASRFRHSVVSLTDVGAIGTELQRHGVEVHALHMRRGMPNPFKLFTLARFFRQLRPDVVKSWLYHGDFAASIARFIGARFPLVWGIHSSSIDPAHLKPASLRIARVCARMSHRVPDAIICDSQASKAMHEQLGYDAEKMIVIANGFDTTAFRPRPDATAVLLRELGLPPETKLVGLAARFDPVKDHRNFLEAARIIRQQCPSAFFVLCGGIGIDEQNARLMSWIDELGLRDSVALLGRRADLPSFMAALHVGVSASATESFPIMVGELMASGVPVVSTDAGDSAFLVDDTGFVVPRRDSAALAAACLRVLEMPEDERVRMGLRGRERIVSGFRLESTVQQYEAVLAEAVS